VDALFANNLDLIIMKIDLGSASIELNNRFENSDLGVAKMTLVPPSRIGNIKMKFSGNSKINAPQTALIAKRILRWGAE